MDAFRRFLGWMERPKISLFDRIVIFAAFSGLLLLCAIPISPAVEGIILIRRVHGHGTDAIARVERDTGFNGWSRVEYDGHTASVPRDFPPGAQPSVVYLANDPKVFAFGHAGDGLLTLYLANVGVEKSFKFIVGLAGAVACLFCVIASCIPAGRRWRPDEKVASSG